MMAQKKKAIGLAVLLVVAAVIWYFNRLGPGTPAGAAVAGVKYTPMSVENSQLHWYRLEASRKMDYKPTGRDPFSTIAPPTAAEIAAADKAQKSQPPPPPPPPPAIVLPVKFFGYGNVPVGTARLAFFTDGDDVFIVGVGDMLLGRFRILHIGNTNLDFEEISSGRRGSASLEEQGPSA